MWHIREREYLTELARERGIEITVKGVDRPGLSLPEYKAAMTEVEEYKEKTAELQIINAGLTAEKKELQLDVKAAEDTIDDLIKEAEDAESRIQKAQEILDDDIFTKNTLLRTLHIGSTKSSFFDSHLENRIKTGDYGLHCRSECVII